ncbi:hypothetical protein M514_10917 [Trichuris suis]|uniref:Uncharacterized protein n=2 Tax=Trichuris suis TaxID=68888 RepID=A0A085MTN7_9BILA|nr:hypothetical protein M514_10917 [Trichuris suis]
MDHFFRQLVLLLSFGFPFGTHIKVNSLKVGTFLGSIVSVSPSRIPISSALGNANVILNRMKYSLSIHGPTFIVIAQPCSTQPSKWQWPLLVIYDTMISKEQLVRVLQRSLNVSEACNQVHGMFKEQRVPKVGNVEVIRLFTKGLTKEEADEPTSERFEEVSLKAALFRFSLNNYAIQHARHETHIAINTSMLFNKSRMENVNLLCQEIASAVEHLHMMERIYQKKERVTRSNQRTESPYTRAPNAPQDAKIREATLLKQRSYNRKHRRHIRTSESKSLMKKPKVIIQSIKVFRNEKIRQPSSSHDSQQHKAPFIPSSLRKTSIANDKMKEKNRTGLLKEAQTLSWRSTRSAHVQETEIPLGNFDEHDEITSEQANYATQAWSMFRVNQTEKKDPPNENATFAIAHLPTHLGNTIAHRLQNKSYNQTSPHLTSEKTETKEKSTASSENTVGDLDSNKNEKGPVRAGGSHLNETSSSVSSVSYGPELSEQGNVSGTVSLLSFDMAAYDTQHTVNFTLSNEKEKRNELINALVANSSQPPNKITSAEKNESVKTEYGEAFHLAGTDRETVFERENSSNEFGVHQTTKVNKGGFGFLDGNLIEKLESWFKQSMGYVVCAASFLLVYACLLLSTATIKQCKHKNKHEERMIMDSKNHNGSKADPQQSQSQVKDEEAGTGIHICSANFSNDIERYNASCHISQSSQSSPVLNNGVNPRLTVFRKRDDSLYLHDDFITGMLNSSNSSNSGCSFTMVKRNNSAPVLSFNDTQIPQGGITISRVLWKELEKHYKPSIRRVASDTLPRKGKCKSLDALSFNEAKKDRSRQYRQLSKSAGPEILQF